MGNSYSVRVRLFPQIDFELVDSAAAMHLFALLQRYNWSLENDLLYQARWTIFWQSLDPVERRLFYIFVMTNTKGVFGQRLKVLHPPIEFETLEGQIGQIPLWPTVKQEFRRLLAKFYRGLVTSEQVADNWKCFCPSEMALLEQAGALDLPFRGEISLDLELFEAHCISALGGVIPDDLAERQRVAGRLRAELENLLFNKEFSLWTTYAES